MLWRSQTRNIRDRQNGQPPRCCSSPSGLSGVYCAMSDEDRGATALPPMAISDSFGLHPGTAVAWASFVKDSWADYLAARAIRDAAH